MNEINEVQIPESTIETTTDGVATPNIENTSVADRLDRIVKLMNECPVCHTQMVDGIDDAPTCPTCMKQNMSEKTLTHSLAAARAFYMSYLMQMRDQEKPILEEGKLITLIPTCLRGVDLEKYGKMMDAKEQVPFSRRERDFIIMYWNIVKLHRHLSERLYNVKIQELVEPVEPVEGESDGTV